MPITIVRLLGYDGPNIYSPQPGVLLQVRCDKDCSKRIKNALKDGGQSVGMVIGYLDVVGVQDDEGYLITATFITPTPRIGVELARSVVDGLNAVEAGAEPEEAEELLWDLQKRRRTEALPIQALRIIAEASTRGIPTFVRPDGALQIGYGTRGWALDLAALKTDRSAGVIAADEIGAGPPSSVRAAPAVAVPWEHLGSIPIVACSGAGNDSTVDRVATTLREQGRNVGSIQSADFAAARSLLTDSSITWAAIGLDLASVAQHGLPFERCAYSAIIDLPETLPTDIADRDELVRVAGLPILVTEPTGCVVLNADVPEITALAEYAPCPVIYISVTESNSTVERHRATNGTVLFVREDTIVMANGTDERIMSYLLPAGEERHGILAALALLWMIGTRSQGSVVRCQGPGVLNQEPRTKNQEQ